MKYRKRTGRRRKPRRVPKRRGNTLYQQSPSYPLGKKVVTKTRYFEKGLSVDGGAGGISSNYLFSANGVYDVNISGIGHSVLGFDQMMLMYDHYVVLGSQIRVDFQNTDAVNTQVVGIYLNDDNTPSLNTEVAVENGAGKYTTLERFNGGAKSTKSLTLKCNPAKYLTRSKPLSDPNLKGTDSANPAEQVYFTIWAADTGSADPSAVEFNVTIEYIIAYIEPKQLGTS